MAQRISEVCGFVDRGLKQIHAQQITQQYVGMNSMARTIGAQEEIVKSAVSEVTKVTVAFRNRCNPLKK